MAKRKLGFTARFNIPFRSPPARGYIYEASVEVYSERKKYGPNERLSPMDCILDHFNKTYSDLAAKSNLNGFSHTIAFVWAMNKDKMIDFFGFSREMDWPGNPEVSSWVTKNGVIVPKKEMGCGDGAIILGREEEYRRTCPDFHTYTENPPKIPGLELKADTTLTL